MCRISLEFCLQGNNDSAKSVGGWANGVPITHRKPVRFGDGLSICHRPTISKEKTAAIISMSSIQNFLWYGRKVRANLISQSPLGNERVPRWQL